MAYKGKFIPQNPQKYNGDHNKIIWRSTWEHKYMRWLDSDPSVIMWSSERVIIPYLSPIDKKYHRYFVDFLVRMRTKNQTIKTYLVEIKPLNQSFPPENRKRISKKFIKEVTTWGVNKAKWTAAIEYAKDRKWEFIVVASDDGNQFRILSENQLMLS